MQDGLPTMVYETDRADVVIGPGLRGKAVVALVDLHGEPAVGVYANHVVLISGELCRSEGRLTCAGVHAEVLAIHMDFGVALIDDPILPRLAAVPASIDIVVRRIRVIGYTD